MKKTVLIIIFLGVSFFCHAEGNDFSLSNNMISMLEFRSNNNSTSSESLFAYSQGDMILRSKNESIIDFDITRYASYQNESFFDVGLPWLGGALTIAGLIMWGVGFSQMAGSSGDAWLLPVTIGTISLGTGITLITVQFW